MTTGDLVLVGIQSWAGLTWHRVRVEKVCPKRLKVYWLDASWRHGTSSYVPQSAVRCDVGGVIVAPDELLQGRRTCAAVVQSKNRRRQQRRERTR